MTADLESFSSCIASRRTSLALLAWTCVMVMAGTLPLSNFVGHSHWEYVEWTIPPHRWSSPTFYADVLANMLLFYPFGLLLARRFEKSSWALLIAGGFLLSMGIESYQVYCHNRHPSPIDLFSNTCGTALGVMMSRRPRRLGRQPAS